MESITDLIISAIMLAIPVAIFFVGFFIVFGELFRLVNTIYTLRFSDSFIAFAINNEGYPFVNPSNNWSTLQLATVKGGFAYVSYDPIVSKKMNVVVYPEPHTYYGVMSGEKVKLFEELAKEYGNPYLRIRFSFGDGYDMFIASPKDNFGAGVFLPNLEMNYLSFVNYTINFPLKVSQSDSVLGNGVPTEVDKVPTYELLYKDFSSSGLITSLNNKNDITPPSGFINAPIVLSNGSVVFDPLWFMILVNRKIYSSLTAYNYFYNKPRVEVYVEALYSPNNELTTLPVDKLGVELIISLSRWIPDYKKLNSAELVITYRYGPFKLVSETYDVSTKAEFFVIPLDWTKSITPDQLSEYEKYSKKIGLDATVSYILTYGGKEYIYSVPVRLELDISGS